MSSRGSATWSNSNRLPAAAQSAADVDGNGPGPAQLNADFAGPPQLDDDYLVLSTIHSAKGLEWDAVYVIHAADGQYPIRHGNQGYRSVEEERRLFYVALTRAKNWLYVLCPLRYYHSYRPQASDHYGMAQANPSCPSRS